MSRTVRDPGGSTSGLHEYHFDDTRIVVVEPFVSQLNALGQKDRLQIFRLLVRVGPQGNCVEEIRRRVKMPGSTLSHHLDALARCGLLTAQRSGRFIYYSINWAKTAKLIRFLTEDCCADLHRTLGASADRSASAKQRR
jgi:ArsR family transcriptional regulator